MIRVFNLNRGRGQEASEDAHWARRTDFPLPMVLAWVAALVLTTEGLLTFQNLYG
jgi:hypothetical protein